jgi:hypothetical protein
LGGRGRQISEFEASLVLQSKFQDNKGYTEKPCLKKKKKKVLGKKKKKASPESIFFFLVILLLPPSKKVKEKIIRG